MEVNWKIINAILVILLITVVIGGKVVEKNRAEDNAILFEQRAAIAVKQPVSIYDALQQGDFHGITLIGDNVTTGMNKTSMNENMQVYASGDEVHYEPVHDSATWANAFRAFTEQQFPQMTFTNAAITNKSAVWFNEQKEHIQIGENELVFVMLGTNDRWATESIEQYEQQYTEFLQHVNAQAKDMVVIISPPAMTDELEMMNFGMDEVAQVTQQICDKQQYTCISFYDAIEQATTQSTPLQTFVQTDGPHFTDKGHTVAWQYFQQQILQ